MSRWPELRDARWLERQFPLKVMADLVGDNYNASARNADGTPKTREIPYAGDSGILLRGQDKAQVNITCNTIGSGELYGYRVDKSQPAEVRAGAIPRVKADSALGKWNRFVITLKKDRVTILLNGQTVIDNVPLPGIPARGPLGLQHHGDPVQFTNLFIKELE